MPGTFFMLYSFAKILMTFGLRFFYRNIYVTGLENIPSKGPVIIIANHNASLMDAALLGILLKRKAWFFARGDVFVNKPVQTILWWLHMMPVHSYMGGRNTLNANSHSFSDGQKILSKGGIIVFFPESYSHIEHQLLPFRKGVFRLAFDTALASNFLFDIPVVPVGITYDHPVACRTSVQVHAGKPLSLATYQQEYKENPAVSLLHICKDAQQAVHQLVLHVTDSKRLETAGHYLTISRNNNIVQAPGWKLATAEKLEREKCICLSVNNAPEYEFENKQQQSGRYFNALNAAGVSDRTVGGPSSFSTWKKILLWIGFPVYLLGLLLNGLPVLISRQIADKKVYRKDFYSWIFVACYSIMYFLWFTALLVIASFRGWQYCIGTLLLLVLTGIFAYTYKDWQQENRQQKKWNALSKERAETLRAMRNGV